MMNNLSPPISKNQKRNPGLIYLTTGSRTWKDREIIHEALHHLTKDDLIVNGGQGHYDERDECYYGADILASQFGFVHSIPVKMDRVSPAEWRKLGLKAGPLRNRRMFATFKPDLVYAFRMVGKSNGTDDMMKVAFAGGVRVMLHYLGRQGLVIQQCQSWEDVRKVLDTESSGRV